MDDQQEKIAAIEQQINLLRSRQFQFNAELEALQKELYKLRTSINYQSRIEPANETQMPEVVSNVAPTPHIKINRPDIEKKSVRPTLSNKKLEDFIGTSLTSKIGILITIIGIFIGAKYAIDKELISPVMRIVLGYLAGSALILTAFRLKKKYLNFSAVLIGGGLAILYFITYISYNFYQLLPQALSFVLMVLITVAAVIIALWYNQKIIAILGQVAAYAIPFILSDGSGSIIILFTYITIINIGLIYLAFKKDWKILYRIAFLISWIISISWLVSRHVQANMFWTGIMFLTINFISFYITFLAYKIVRKEMYSFGEVGIVLVNALIYFLFGYGFIKEHFNNGHFLAVFALANAGTHLIIALIVYRLKLADATVYQFILGLGLLFVTVAIPIEFSGSWVTLLWTIEATILCWIAIKNNRNIYLKMAAPMIVIAVLSLVQDWMVSYSPDYSLRNNTLSLRNPFFNLTFLSSCMVALCFGVLHFKTYKHIIANRPLLSKFFTQAMPLIFWGTLYFTFFIEISYFWNLRIDYSIAERNQPAVHYQPLSLIIYTLMFFAVLLELNKKLFKNRSVDDRLLIGGVFICLLYLVLGLYHIGNLRNIYVLQSKTSDPSTWLLGVRYISFIALTIFWYAEWGAVARVDTTNSRRIFSVIFNITLLTIICNEFVHWMDLAGYQNQYKLGLSIIFGVYAMLLIIAGIVKRKQHLRVFAIVLFAATLLKFFFYDLASLSTISKTIVLVVLGILLLIVSFLYNKYKHIILGED